MTVQPDWLAEKQALVADHAAATPCPRCGAETLTARAGRVAALDVRADPRPLTALEEILARLSGRLTWHLVTAAGPQPIQRITWRHPALTNGPSRWPVIADHECGEAANTSPHPPVQETLL